MRQLGSSILLGVTMMVACVQGTEVIAVAADDDGGGGAGGESSAGGGLPPLLLPSLLDAPPCGGAADEVAIGQVAGSAGPDVLVGGDGCVALYTAEGTALGAPISVASSSGVALAIGRLHTTSPEGGTAPGDIVRAGDTLAVLVNDGAGSFSQGQVLPLAVPVIPGGLQLADLGSDGALDLAYGDMTRVIVRYGVGDGTFGDEHFFTVAGGARQLAVGDLNDDGFNDIVAAGEGATLLLADGQGAFHSPQPLAGGDHVGTVTLLDLNGDGCLDAAGVEGSPLGPSLGSARIMTWVGDCEGHLDASASVAAPFAMGVTAGDFDLDGHPDLVVPRADDILVLTLDSDGAPSTEHVIPLDATPRRAQAIDLGGDGRLELVVAAGERLFLLRAP